MLPRIQGSDWLAQLNKSLAGGAGAIGHLLVARFEFDWAGKDSAGADNSAVGAHGLGIFLPAHSIICGGFNDVNTVLTSADSTATVAVKVEGANDIQTAAAVSGAPWSTIGRKAIVPKANTPESTSVKTTVAREITVTVAVQALTAGKFTGYLHFLPGIASA
jgi:hypothetical protein